MLPRHPLHQARGDREPEVLRADPGLRDAALYVAGRERREFCGEPTRDSLALGRIRHAIPVDLPGRDGALDHCLHLEPLSACISMAETTRYPAVPFQPR